MMENMFTNEVDQVKLTIGGHIIPSSSSSNRGSYGFLAKPDCNPQAWIYIRHHNNQWILHEKTEILHNTLKPIFTKTFTMNYSFQQYPHHHQIRIELYHISLIGYSELIGIAHVDIGCILSSKTQMLMVNLHSKCEKYAGMIAVSIDNIRKTNDEYELEWKGNKLLNTDKSFVKLRWFDKSDPFLRLFRSQCNGNSACDWIKVHQTEYIMDNLNPKWKPFKIMSDKLTLGDINKPLKIECWDWEEDGNFQFIGEFVFTIKDMMKIEEKKFKLYNNKLQKNTGTLKLTRFIITEKFTFLDYLLGGLALNTMIGIPYLHSSTQSQSNKSFPTIEQYNLFHQYHQPIMDICQILLNHESNTMLPIYGFNTQCGCFPLAWLTKNLHDGGDYSSIEREGRKGEGLSSSSTIISELKRILEAYTLSLKSNEASGAYSRSSSDGNNDSMSLIPVLKEMIKVVEINKANNTRAYSVFILIVDHRISDMPSTIDHVLKKSHLPISLIFISIDNNIDFKAMEALKNTTLKSNTSYRDFMQFIEIRKAITKPPHELKAEILSKVANQVVEYMRLMGIKPVKTPCVNMATIFKDILSHVDNTAVGGGAGICNTFLLNKTGLISNNGNIFMYPSFTQNQIFVQKNIENTAFTAQNQVFLINPARDPPPQAQTQSRHQPQAPTQAKYQPEPHAPTQANLQAKTVLEKPSDPLNDIAFDFELISFDSANTSSSSTTNKDPNTAIVDDLSEMSTSNKQAKDTLVSDNMAISEFVIEPPVSR